MHIYIYAYILYMHIYIYLKNFANVSLFSGYCIKNSNMQNFL